jgi:hypothetical protein
LLKELLATTLWIRLRIIVNNTLVLFISLLVVLDICKIILRVYNPLGFRIKGNKITLPVNNQEIIDHEGPGTLGRVVIHQNNSLGFRYKAPLA